MCRDPQEVYCGMANVTGNVTGTGTVSDSDSGDCESNNGDRDSVSGD